MYKSSKNINNEAQNKARLLSLSLSLSLRSSAFLLENLNNLADNRFSLSRLFLDCKDCAFMGIIDAFLFNINLLKKSLLI